MAKHLSYSSTCKRRGYGAVIIKNNKILSTGYNHQIGTKCNPCPRDEYNIPHGKNYEMCRSIHAEATAILKLSTRQLSGSTLILAGIDSEGQYLSDTESCMMCKRMIIESGISEVIYYRRENDNNVIYSVDPKSWIGEPFI